MPMISRDIQRPLSRGVAVFTKNHRFDILLDSIYNDRNGHYCSAVLSKGKTIFILMAVCGPSTSADAGALYIFTEITDKI